MIKRLFLTIALLVCFAASVFADQALLISKDEANKAVEILKTAKSIKHLCEPCGDKTPKTEDINKLEAVSANYENFWMVKVNDEGVDLAYVYFLESEKGKWKNLGLHLEIEGVDDVSLYLNNDSSGEK